MNDGCSAGVAPEPTPKFLAEMRRERSDQLQEREHRSAADLRGFLQRVRENHHLDASPLLF